MKTCWGSESIAPYIRNFGTRWKRVVSFTLWPPYSQGKTPDRYLLDRRLGGPHSRPGRGGKEKKSLPCLLPGIGPWSSSRSPVTTLTDPQWFHLCIKCQLKLPFFARWRSMVSSLPCSLLLWGKSLVSFG
jgi:hypothetical protein